MADSTVLLLDGVDLAKDATFTGGSWSTTHPLANIKTRYLSDAARTADTASTSTRFLIDNVTTKTFGGVSLGWTNLSQFAKARIRYGSVTALRTALTPDSTRTLTNATATTGTANTSVDEDPDGTPADEVANDSDAQATMQIGFTDTGTALRNGTDYQIVRVRAEAPSSVTTACTIDKVELYENAALLEDITPVEGTDVPTGYLTVAAGTARIFEITYKANGLGTDDDQEIKIYWSGGNGSGDFAITSVRIEALLADAGATDKDWIPLLPSGILGSTLGDSHMAGFLKRRTWAWANATAGVYSDVTASRYILVEILDPSNAAGYVEIGRAMACPLIAGGALEWPQGPATTVAHGMARSGNENRRTMNIPFSLLERAAAAQIIAFGAATYEDAQMCVIPLPEVTASNFGWQELMPMHGEYKIPVAFSRHSLAALMVGAFQLRGF
ncbi:MAG: hypothetical protein O7A04_09340 [Acidobacteria bacterium]|nr:hypothetical protein [Acidobacteriota bacterium]